MACRGQPFFVRLIRVSPESRSYSESAGKESITYSILCLPLMLRCSNKGKPELDFARLKAIREKVDIPLVLHGGSDLPESQIRSALECGIRKINFGTDVKLAFAQTMKKVLSRDPMPFQPIQILSPCRNAIAEEVRKKIRLAHSEGLAGRVTAGAV